MLPYIYISSFLRIPIYFEVDVHSALIGFSRAAAADQKLLYVYNTDPHTQQCRDKCTQVANGAHTQKSILLLLLLVVNKVKV